MTNQNNFTLELIEDRAEKIEDYLNENLSGSGFNCDWEVTKIQNNKTIVIESAFHCMNEHGYYEGYQDFVIKVPVSDKNKIVDFKLHFTGARYLAEKHMLRDYIEEQVHYVLNNLLSEPSL